MQVKKIGIVVQCRDNSTRYREKSVRPFYKGKSILEIIIERFQIYDYPIIVATTKSSLKTKVLCNLMGTSCYVGDERRVALRLVEAADRYNLDGFLRVCADNPFIDLGLMYPVITWAETMDYDYVAFDNCMMRHEGFFVEFIKIDALWKTLNNTNSEYDLEHVTPYIIRHPELFKQMILPIPPIMNRVFTRLTVDTEDDFKMAQKVYKHVGGKHWHRVLEYIEDNPKIEKKMLESMRLNKK